MKRIFRFITLAAAALMPLAGCQKAEITANPKTGVTFIAQSIETRTAFGTPSGDTYPTLWTENDTKVAVSLNLAESKSADVIAAPDYRSATFDVTIEDDNSGSYTFDIVSPASALIGVSKTKGLNVNIPTTQTPTAASVDEAAQILVAKTAALTAFPTEPVSVNFAHMTAYGKISILNLQSGAVISSITLTADEKWAGRWNNNAGVISENSASESITVNTTSATDIWFACAPVDLGGKHIKVTVTTDKGDFVKTITLPSGKKFESGKIAKFSVNFSGITPKADDVYTLVTSLDDLTVDSKVVIAARDYNLALSTTQNSNNRATAAATKTGNTIVNPADGVQILTLKKSSVANTVAFYTGAGYLTAVSGSDNYLRATASLSEYTSFAVSFDSDSTIIKCTASGAKKNTLLYNKNSNLFSCYSTGQLATAIYKLDGSGTSEKIFDGSTPVVPDVPVYSNLAALVAAGTPTTDGKTVTVTLTNEPIKSIYTTGSGYRNGIFVDAGDKEIEIYCKDVPATWVAGGTVSGTLTCPWKLYSGTWELCPAAWTELTYTAPANVAVTGITIDSTLELTVGSNSTLTATVAPSNATVKTLTWSSSNTSVATVDQTGKVTAVAAGTATITAAANDGSGVKGTCAVTVKASSTPGGETVTLFTEGFGNNTGSIRVWSDSYKEQGGISTVYSNAAYTMMNLKQGKNTTGSTLSGINQTTAGTDAVFEFGPLNVSGYTDLQLSYKWKAASIKGTYFTKVYYKTSQGSSYTEVATTGTGATTFVDVTASLPAAANGSSTLYLKIVFNTSNTQAVIDEVKLTGKN